MTTFDRVLPILRRELALDHDSHVHPHTELADLGADSLDLLEIVMEMEKEFGIDINELAWEKHSVTVADLIAAAEQRSATR